MVRNGLILLTLAAVLLATAALAAVQPPPGWASYRNEKFGFVLSYPPDLFDAGKANDPQAGGLWISRDRQARLVAVAGANGTGETPQSYRDFVMRESYDGARFDYAPLRDTWFVLSGTKGDLMFYERIDFVCRGKYIYGWQLFYPARQRRLYDPIITAIHRTYRPGQGENDKCEG